MITLLPEKEKNTVKKIFDSKNIEYTDNSGCVTAKFGEEVLGMCLYYLDKKSMTILHIEPTDDIMLLDGILRSTIHVATESFVLDVRYGEKTDERIFEKLDFIKDKTTRSLDVDKLFKGCNCHKEKG